MFRHVFRTFGCSRIPPAGHRLPRKIPQNSRSARPARGFSLCFFFARLRLSAPDWGNLMRYRTDYLPRLQPWSLSAFAAAVAAVVFAATLQEIVASFGITPYFAGFI